MTLVYELIDIFSLFPPLIAVLGGFFGLKYYNKLDNNLKPLVFLLLLGFANDYLSRIFGIVFESNLHFFNTYAFIELVLMYAYLISFLKKSKQIFNVFFVLLMLFNIYEFIFIDFFSIVDFQVYSRVFNCVFLLILNFFILIKNLENETIEKVDYIFFLLPCYFAISTVLSLPVNFLVNYVDIKIFLIWLFNNFLFCFFYGLIFYQIWKFGNKKILK